MGKKQNAKDIKTLYPDILVYCSMVRIVVMKALI